MVQKYDEFIGDWTPEEKALIGEVIDLPKNKATNYNAWIFRKHNDSNFSAGRDTWSCGWLEASSAVDLVKSIRANLEDTKLFYGKKDSPSSGFGR